MTSCRCVDVHRVGAQRSDDRRLLNLRPQETHGWWACRLDTPRIPHELQAVGEQASLGQPRDVTPRLRITQNLSLHHVLCDLLGTKDRDNRRHLQSRALIVLLVGVLEGSSVAATSLMGLEASGADPIRMRQLGFLSHTDP
jgi:hypothetical protein